MPRPASISKTHCPALTSPVSDGLVKIWISQRNLLRAMDAHRQLDSLSADSFATEVVTDGYYLVRKNLFDLVTLNRDLPHNASISERNSRPPMVAVSEIPDTSSNETAHNILAQNLGALHALAADYASLQAEAATEKASAIFAVVQQHSRQLKAFLTNLFPDRVSA
ncbi:hypothetical protein [Oleiharenicola lentus]|uniref:hypothetical protein n=1 Tax=Oleiharenicola lentus TaxID=2508720 RepID=UPI003F673D8E